MEAVAQAAKVSRATVSRVLSGSTNVSAAVRRSVLDAVDRLGYVPNVMAQSLASRSSDMLGLLLRDPRVPAYALLHSVIQREVSRSRLHMISAVPDTEEGETHERAALDRLIGLRVAGLIISTGLLSSELIAPLTSRLPVVVVGRPEQHPDIYSISYDEEDNARLMASAVANYGHRRVAVLSPIWGTETIRARLCIDLLRARGVEVVELTANLFNTPDEHCETVIAMARRGEITAAMFPSDHRLIRFLTEAKRAGLRVPEDLSVTGWDGGYDDDGLLGLTTVRIPIEAAAGRAATRRRSGLVCASPFCGGGVGGWWNSRRPCSTRGMSTARR